MAYEVGQADLRRRAEIYVAKANSRARWIMLAFSGFAFVLMTSLPIFVFEDDLLHGPAGLLLIPSVGWLVALAFHALAVALGPGEAMVEEEEGHVRGVRRWRLITFIGAIMAWLLTGIVTFVVWSANAAVSKNPASWEALIISIACSLGTFAATIWIDSQWARRNSLRTAMRKLVAEEIVSQMETPNPDKPKRKREEQAPLLGDDGEFAVKDNASHMTNAKKL
ncbi:MAG TPA: hypothetical protein VKQ72_08050 [Aggregatilineales bacterium]|nr:hypothetical protein [Aggregatilineales bacterium]